MDNLKDFQKLVVANAKHVKGLIIGEKAPDFILQNSYGKAVSLSESLNSGPVILKFYRGEWCPICNLDLREIQRYIFQFKKYGAQVLAISPQEPDHALTIVNKNALGFEVLSDSSQKVIRAYNLQFDPGEDYHQRRDLSVLNGDGLRTLPVPATFIINTDFTIAGAHIEANYTVRMSPEEILKILKEIES